MLDEKKNVIKFNRYPMVLCILVLVSVSSFTQAAEIDIKAWDIHGTRYNGTNHERQLIGGIWVYVIDTGGTREHRDGDTPLEGHEMRWFDASTDCGVGDHKPGGNKMCHAHVESGVDYPTQAFNGLPEITQAEAEKFWSVRIYHEGCDGYANIPDPIYDGADSRVEWGSASYHSNCYGFVFEETIGKYNLVIDDGAVGAQKVLDAEYDEQDNDDNRLGTVMYISGSHANYVCGVWVDCSQNVGTIQFKFRDSQGFTFCYDYPGRDYDKAWRGTVPSYWLEK